MTDHAPSVVAPGTLREALETALAVALHEQADPECNGDPPYSLTEGHAKSITDAVMRTPLVAAALRAESVAAPLDVTAVAHHLMRAGWFRDEDRARREAAAIILAAQTGDRYDLDDDQLTPDQRKSLAALHAPPALDAAPGEQERDNWMETARLYTQNADYWRSRAERIDVERLTAAIWGMHWDPDANRLARKIAAEYERLAATPASGEPAPDGYYEVLHAKSRNVVADFPTEDEARSYAALDSELTYRYRLNGSSPTAGAEEPPR